MSKLAANLKESLPHGSQKELAKRLKVSAYVINRAVNGEKCPPYLQAGIAEYMEELAAQKKAADEKIQQAIAILQA